MDNIHRFIGLINDFRTSNLKELPLSKYGEHQGIKYVYYSQNSYRVDFNLKTMRLTVENISRDEKIDYRIRYPRYASNSNPDSKVFFNFIFSIERQEGELGVVIINGSQVEDYLELYNSDLRLEIKNRDDYFDMDKIKRWQERIYRNMGIGGGLFDLKIGEDEIRRLAMDRDEFNYIYNGLVLDYEFDNLIEKMGKKRMNQIELLYILGHLDNKESYGLDQLSLKYGLTESNYKTMELVQRKRVENASLREEILKKHRRTERGLTSLRTPVEANIYLNQIESFAQGFDLEDTLRVYGLSLDDDIIETYKKILRPRSEKYGLNVDEVWQLISSYKRKVNEVLRLEFREEFRRY